MTTLRLAALAALLAACGADGPPEPPTRAPAPGLSVSGDARIGLGWSTP